MKLVSRIPAENVMLSFRLHPPKSGVPRCQHIQPVVSLRVNPTAKHTPPKRYWNASLFFSQGEIRRENEDTPLIVAKVCQTNIGRVLLTNFKSYFLLLRIRNFFVALLGFFWFDVLLSICTGIPI